MKNRLVLSLSIVALTLLSALPRADAAEWDLLRVYTLADGKGVAVAVPGTWQEVSKTRVLGAGAPALFLDESGRRVEIPAAALARASESRTVARPEEAQKMALRTRSGS